MQKTSSLSASTTQHSSVEAQRTAAPPAKPSVQNGPERRAGSQSSGRRAAKDSQSSDDSAPTGGHATVPDVGAWQAACAASGLTLSSQLPASKTADALVDSSMTGGQGADAGFDSLSEADSTAFSGSLANSMASVSPLNGPLRLQVEGVIGHPPFEMVLTPSQAGMQVQLVVANEQQRRRMIALLDAAKRTDGHRLDRDQAERAAPSPIEVLVCSDSSTALPPRTA